MLVVAVMSPRPTLSRLGLIDEMHLQYDWLQSFWNDPKLSSPKFVKAGMPAGRYPRWDEVIVTKPADSWYDARQPEAGLIRAVGYFVPEHSSWTRLVEAATKAFAYRDWYADCLKNEAQSVTDETRTLIEAAVGTAYRTVLLHLYLANHARITNVRPRKLRLYWTRNREWIAQQITTGAYSYSQPPCPRERN